MPYMYIKDLFKTRCKLGLRRLQLVPQFYKDILKVWNELFKQNVPDTPALVRREALWFNEYITIEGDTLFFKHWYRQGIMFIDDIVDDNGFFLDTDVLQDNFNINVSFLEYFQLRSAIPGGWRQIVRTKSMQRSVNQHFEYNIQLRNTVKVIT